MKGSQSSIFGVDCRRYCGRSGPFGELCVRIVTMEVLVLVAPKRKFVGTRASCQAESGEAGQGDVVDSEVADSCRGSKELD